LRSAIACAAAKAISPVTSAGKTTPKMAISAIENDQASLSATMTGSLRVRAAPCFWPNYAAPTTTPARTGDRSGRALASLIVGIVSIPGALFAILGLVLGIVAIVLGATARSDMSRRGQATAGIVLGAIGAVLALANMVAGAAMNS
jgi:hypothetical protein